MSGTTRLHDDDAGALELAIACRLLHHYKHAIERAENRGAAVSGLPEVVWLDIAKRHERLIDEHLRASAENPLQVRALHQFAAFALLDEQIGDLFGYGPIVDDEANRAQALRALMAIGQFVNEAEIDEAIDRERKTPLPDGSHGSYILDQMRAALDRIQAGKGGAAMSAPDPAAGAAEPNPGRDPDHDRHSASIYRAIALRFYARYVDARTAAEFRGEDIEGHAPLPTQLDASEQYKRAVSEWLWETPQTEDVILALVEFAGVIAADKLISEVFRENGPVGEETDAFHQAIALAAVGARLNERSMVEWLDRRRAAYGPGGMAPKGLAQ
jgi:hypothetical protein